MSVTVPATVISLSLVAIGLFLAFPTVFRGETLTEDFNVSRDIVDPNGPAVQFVLFTSYNLPIMLEPNNNSTLNSSGFDFGNPTKIITHGFMSSIKNDVFKVIQTAYLETGLYNVIGMDWSKLCQTEYASAMRGAKTAGQQLGDFIHWLTFNGVNIADVHLIGHSLGAHVAGIGADSVKGGRVGRITGLDPAGPGYRDIKEELKLDPQDAQLVDVVHTFMRVIGTARPSGHVDFYPNGGKYQPGCPDITNLAESILCNHGRSYYLFAESIRKPQSFPSTRCSTLDEALASRCLEESQVFMGVRETYKNGLYYFKTRSSPPYSINNTREK
ncbi:pancreatic lipase-related protein 2-like isoform X1 [Euwallacea fornicatus]|uniref:pancreatic lipase-related protein 2-like isoform X1 n=2 Tax=Euwallacea fornicatus TaxID=995702 RepID=UPI00338F5E27